jgi:exonuclease III
MILASWNCRGFGSKRKEEALKDITKASKSNILLLQETKMSQQDSLKASMNVWRDSQGIAGNARGASGGLCTLWNTSKIDLISSDTCMHWIHTKLLHKDLGYLVSLFNIYVPQHIEEKKHCWETLKEFL